jgi:Cation efflux family
MKERHRGPGSQPLEVNPLTEFGQQGAVARADELPDGGRQVGADASDAEEPSIGDQRGQRLAERLDGTRTARVRTRSEGVAPLGFEKEPDLAQGAGDANLVKHTLSVAWACRWEGRGVHGASNDGTDTLASLNDQRYTRGMDACCAVRAVPARQRRVLQLVLGINGAMFLVEFGAGVAANSTALLADSIDMLGDAIVYGFSLYVVTRGVRWQARAALLKGVIMAAFGVGLLVQVALKLALGLKPSAEVMGGIGLLALVANLICLALLWGRRGDDINMRSAWICSRNDVMGNAGVLLAAAGVALTGAPWPDIVIGLLLAVVFGSSAVKVIGEARHQLAVT